MDLSENVIKPLKTHFVRNNIYQMDMFRRNEKFAFYTVIDSSANKIIGYEIHKLRISKTHPLYESEFSHYEKLANDKEFGRYGWYFMHNELSRANQKWEELNEA